MQDWEGMDISNDDPEYAEWAEEAREFHANPEKLGPQMAFVGLRKDLNIVLVFIAPEPAPSHSG